MGGRRWNRLSRRGGGGGVGSYRSYRWGPGGGRAFREHHDTKRKDRHEDVQEVRVEEWEGGEREAAEGFAESV